MARPVHYHAHGGAVLRFECFKREMDAHLASRRTVPGALPGWTTTVTDVPPPRRSTDLNAVTCDECWQAIYEMAREHLK